MPISLPAQTQDRIIFIHDSGYHDNVLQLLISVLFANFVM
jgi:hypothetical protein